MIDFNKIIDICNQYCENVSIKSGGNGIIMRCPFCGDSKKSSRTRRFHIDYYSPYQTYIGRCYNGGCTFYDEPSDIIKICSLLKGISYIQAKKDLVENVYNSKTVKDKLSNTPNEVEEEENRDIGILDLDIDKECLKISSIPNSRIEKRFHDALLSFIKDRKIPVECFVAIHGRYKGRIIIPIYIKGKLVYFQGRAIEDSKEPKYLNPYVEKEHFILNIEKFDRNRSIIVTEGPIDGYMVEYDQGTSSLGATISDDLLEILFDHTDEDVIVAFDNPTIDKSGYKTLMKMIKESKYGKKVKYFIMPYKDIKDLNELKIKKNIDNIYQFVIDHSHTHFYISTKYKLS